mgnify:CR=1 FL=1
MDLRKYIIEDRSISIYRISKISGIPESTIRNALKKDLDQMTIRVLKGIALALGEKPEVLLKELLREENSNNV